MEDIWSSDNEKSWQSFATLLCYTLYPFNSDASIVYTTCLRWVSYLTIVLVIVSINQACDQIEVATGKAFTPCRSRRKTLNEPLPVNAYEMSFLRTELSILWPMNYSSNFLLLFFISSSKGQEIHLNRVNIEY